MSPIVVGFWGAFFGCAAMALVVSVLAFVRTSRRIALRSSAAALLPAAYAFAFLGWVPTLSGAALQRAQSWTAILSAVVLILLLFLLLGTRRKAPRAARVLFALAATLLVLGATALRPDEALRLSIGVATLAAIGAVLVSILRARRGERVGRLALAALPCLSIAMAGLDVHVLRAGGAPTALLVLSAVAGMGYLLCIGAAVWTRYAYLLEVRKAMTHGPDYDPVSGMQVVQAGKADRAFLANADARPVGIVAVSIANLKLVEELHGRAAFNHAVFVCASRLRSISLLGAHACRLHDDGFVFVTPSPAGGQQLVDQARQALRRLSRPVMLGTSHDAHDLEAKGAVWEPVLGIGIVLEGSSMPLELAIAGARDVSRSAWSFPTRMAYYDEADAAIREVPLEDA